MSTALARCLLAFLCLGSIVQTAQAEENCSRDKLRRELKEVQATLPGLQKGLIEIQATTKEIKKLIEEAQASMKENSERLKESKERCDKAKREKNQAEYFYCDNVKEWEDIIGKQEKNIQELEGGVKSSKENEVTQRNNIALTHRLIDLTQKQIEVCPNE